MKNILFASIISLTLSSCTIVGNYYIVNKSQTSLDVTLNVHQINQSVIENYIIRIDDISEKKIMYNSYKKMDKRTIQIDSLKKRFQFTIAPGEIAHIGEGPNTWIWNVKNILISNNSEVTELDGSAYNQFDIRKSGLFKYVGVKELN